MNQLAHALQTQNSNPDATVSVRAGLRYLSVTCMTLIILNLYVIGEETLFLRNLNTGVGTNAVTDKQL